MPTHKQLAGLCPKRLERANGYIARHIEQGRLPGAVTLVLRQGACVHVNIQGWSDMENQVPLAENSIFRIYSLTKIVTSVALLQLYEQGLLDLNDPVSEFLPSFNQQRVRLPNGREEAANRPASIYDLLRHCGGLAPGPDLDALLASGHTLETFTDELGSQALDAQPGTTWIYGYSTDVLARIIELVSGLSFDAYLQREIFEPLEMADTGFSLSETQAERLTMLYRLNAEGQLSIMDDNGPDRQFGIKRAFLSGSAGLVSTPRDYLRFARMLLNRGRLGSAQLLGRKTVELMSLDHLPAGHPNLQIGNQEFRFGLGVSTMTDIARSRCLSSLGEFGWGGAAGTQVWINPEEDMVVMIMIQVRADIPTGIMDGYKRLIYQALID